MRKLATGLLGVAACSALACSSDKLTVVNKDNPDVTRALATPASIENVLGSVYKQIHTGLHGSTTALDPSLTVMSLESYATVANNGMQVRTAIPRGPITNERNNVTANENFRDFSQMERRARDAANGVQALDALIKGGGTLEQKGSTPTGKDRRARAFGFFGSGVALGNLALVYDSAIVVTPATKNPETLDQVPGFSYHTAVMDTALMMLDSALAIATPAGFGSIDPAWIALPGAASMSQANFIRLIRSYKARFRASVARTPAERAAVDWTKVIADAEAGISSDFVIQIQSGWGLSFNGALVFQDDSRGWHQMSPMYYGMADTSGAYAAWIASSMSQRAPFLIKTPDLRWPWGETRAEQRASSPSTWDYTKYPYIRNRSGQDTPGEPFGTSWYDFYRFKDINAQGSKGPWIAMAKVEIDLLAAEGYLRKNNIAAAAALIDKSRTRANLPPVTGNVATATDPVPGSTYQKRFRIDTTQVRPDSIKIDTVFVRYDMVATVPGKANCVPRVPSGGSTACGNIFEALKYEKRMETAFTGYAQWYFDSRGWGDLVENTALEFPVPYQEMDSRSKPFYPLGGAGGKSAAAKGTYGF